MKLFCALAALSAASALAAVNPQLHQVKHVYILAMSAGMDQFLANQLTKSGIFEVVTDPKRADAIITDRVGESFENKLDELYPPPPKKKVETKAAADSGDDQSKDDESKNVKATDQLANVDLTGGYRPSTFGRGKGNIFIVSRADRAVIWSIFEPSKDNTPRELTKTAARVVKRLEQDLAPPKKSGE